MNSKNDYEKHVEAWENHFKALDGGSDRWHELTAKELCKLLAHTTLGLNGGPTDRMGDAAEVVGFNKHNVVPTGGGSYQVVTLIEFCDEETVH